MEELDLEPVESAFVSQDAARLIAQLDEWFKMRLDVLNQYKKAEIIDLGGEIIKDERVIQGVRLGLEIATMTLGDALPVEVKSRD